MHSIVIASNPVRSRRFPYEGLRSDVVEDSLNEYYVAVFTELAFQRRDMTGGIVVANCALSAFAIYRIRILRLHFGREGRRYTPTFRDRGQRFLGTLRGGRRKLFGGPREASDTPSCPDSGS